MQWVRLSLSLSPPHASPLPAAIPTLAHFNLPLTSLVFFPLRLKGSAAGVQPAAGVQVPKLMLAS